MQTKIQNRHTCANNELEIENYFFLMLGANFVRIVLCSLTSRLM